MDFDLAAVITRKLATRRKALGMSHAALSKRSGVPIATVKRILGGRAGAASLTNVLAVARAMGMKLALGETSVEGMVEARAREKAGGIARARGDGTPEEIERVVMELLAGSRRSLWAE